MELLFLLSLKNLVSLINAFLCLFPATYLLFYYNRTREVNFLIFAVFFLMTSVNLLFNLGRDFFVLNVFVEQVIQSSGFVVWLLLFLHVARVKWSNRQKLVTCFVLFWFFISQIFIFLFRLVPIPQEGYFFSLVKVRSVGLSDKSFYGNMVNGLGVGLIIGEDTIVMSQGYEIIYLLFRLFVSLFAIYVYLTAEIPMVSYKIRNIKYLWFIIGVVSSLHPLVYLGHYFYLWEANLYLSSVVNFITIALVLFIAVKYPECIMLSHNVIAWLATRNVTKLNIEDSSVPLTLNSMADYLKEVAELRHIKVE